MKIRKPLVHVQKFSLALIEILFTSYIKICSIFQTDFKSDMAYASCPELIIVPKMLSRTW